MGTTPGWHWDEMKQVGVDFEDARQVADYDRKQGSDRAAERALCDRLGVSTGSEVVDLGCGTGSFALEAARIGARVRAVDVSGAMLAFVADRAAEEGLANLTTEHAGFLTCEASRDSVDVVVTRFALHHLPDFWKQVALLRLGEMIRPSGQLFVRDVVFSFEAERYAEHLEDWIDRMPKASGFAASEFETHVREEYSTFAWVLEGCIERAGFRILEREYPAPEYAAYRCVRD